MANRFWVGGTNTWNATLTGKWATTSGGASGAAVPTAADDVFFDAASGAAVVTLSTGIVCRSVNCTGFTGTISHPAATTLSIGDATAGASSIALKFVAGMTYTTGASTSEVDLISTSGTLQTIDGGGKTFRDFVINGLGGNYQLASAFIGNSGSQIKVLAGTFSTNNLNMSIGGFNCSSSSVRTVNLGSSTITMQAAAFDCTTSTNMTLNAGTSVVGWTISTTVTPTIAIPNLALYDVLVTKSSGGMTLNGTGTATFHNLTMDNTVVGGGNRAININTSAGIAITGIFKHYGATATNAGFIFSGTTGSARTIALGTTGSVDFNNVDFRDITVTGTAAPVTGTRFGDGGGNSGITFPASVTMYYIGGSSTWNTTTAWSLTSGGSSAGAIPLIHDNAIIDANSFTSAGQVVSMNNQRVCTIDASTATNSPTFRFTNPSGAANSHYGGLIFPTAGSTIDAVGAAGSATIIQLFGRGSHSLTTNGSSIGSTISVTLNGPGSTYTLGSDFNMTDSSRALTHTFGTFNANGKNVTTGTYSSNNANTRALTMGSGTWTITGTSGTIWNISNGTNMTMNTGTATLVMNVSAAGTRTLSSAVAYPATQISGSDTVVSSGLGVTAPSLDFTGFTGQWQAAGSTIGSLTLNPGMTMSYSNTVNITGTLNATGSLGNLITIKSATAGTQKTLSKTSGTVSADYLSLQDSAATGGATWYAGANSTNVSNNSGWIFTAPPVTGGNIKVYSGSAFGAKPVKVWNGSAWVTKPLKVYNGTIWVKTTY